MDMIKSAKGSAQDDDFEEDEDFVLKKKSSTATRSKGELRVNVDGKSAPNQKANTPRSKHSATEQRRRSKINDRFQMLRDIIPESDQKRDKASFLLEEKVRMYKGTHQGWNHEPSKLMPWKQPAEKYADQSRVINGVSAPALGFSAKFDKKNITFAPNIPGSAKNSIESDMSTATTFRSKDLRPTMTKKAMSFPVSLQPNFIPSAQSTGMAAQPPSRLPSDSENKASQPQSAVCHSGSSTTNGALPIEKLKEQELTIERGTISISSVYSRRLLNTLTQALLASGVDLSHTSISVQIALGKKSSSSSIATTSTHKGGDAPPTNQGTARSRVGCGEDSDQSLKKLRT